MSPTLIIAGIQATLRAAQAGADLYAEHARDRKIFLPNLQLPPGDREDHLNEFIRKHLDLLVSSPPLKKVWREQGNAAATEPRTDFEEAYAAMLEHMATAELAPAQREDEEVRRDARMRAAGRMVEQWRQDLKPPTALARVALTLVDVGLEFVGSNPSILGLSTRGENLVVAFAQNLTILIPDDVSEFGPRIHFADRVVGIFLRAGLATLSQNTAVIIKDEDVTRLVTGVVTPIVDALPERVDQQFRFRQLVDRLAGPAAEAAFRILAENTEGYFGKNFASARALGVVTRALFEQLKETAGAGSIADVFSESGLIRLYQAGLTIVTDRPELFVGADQTEKAQLFRDLLSGAAGTLKAYPQFKGPLAASLAASVLQTVGLHAPVLLKLDAANPWENVARQTLEQVANGLAEALKADGPNRRGAFKAFTDTQVIELGRIVVEEIARTPGMLGIERTELHTIVSGIAEAISQDDNLLLSPEQWLTLASDIAAQAAVNPGRLFGLGGDEPEQSLLGAVITSVLQTASRHWADGGRDREDGSPLLFGDTLEQVLALAVAAMAGNVTGIREHPDAIEKLLESILAKAAGTSDRLGSQNLVAVFEQFVGRVVVKGTQPTGDQITKALAA